MEAWSLRQRKKKKEEKWGSVAGRVADRSNKNSSSLEPKELYFWFYSLHTATSQPVATKAAEVPTNPAPTLESKVTLLMDAMGETREDIATMSTEIGELREGLEEFDNKDVVDEVSSEILPLVREQVEAPLK